MLDEVISKTSKCRFEFKCLDKDSQHPHCKGDNTFGENHMFVKEYEADFDCPYHVNFFCGTDICTCPVHCSLHRKQDRSGLTNPSTMGHIETVYDLPKDLTMFKAVGKMTADDFFDCLASFYNRGVTQLTLWDLTEADLTEIATGEIQNFAEYARHLAEARMGGKTAIVFRGKFDFGLGRMFETYLELAGLPLKIHVCRCLDAARKWLGVGGDHDCRNW